MSLPPKTTGAPHGPPASPARKAISAWVSPPPLLRVQTMPLRVALMKTDGPESDSPVTRGTTTCGDTVVPFALSCIARSSFGLRSPLTADGL